MTERGTLPLGKKIRSTTNPLEYSQKALAYIAGIDRAIVSKIERGEKNITAVKLLQVGDALEIPMRELVEFYPCSI